MQQNKILTKRRYQPFVDIKVNVKVVTLHELYKEIRTFFTQ